ncbi:MAG TPA: 3-deoxy-7-phosphoheptulonate synthase, partial [Brevibacterium sp.]|nr:3-deoxy-7-phosphoheptulonate synthase [Brevibacterium sp.]
MSLHADPRFDAVGSVPATPETLAGLEEWRGLAPQQQPTYTDAAELETALTELRSVPPLIFAGEADLLRSRMADAAEGRAFILAG